MDPVTLAVMRGALEQIADEMDLHLIKAALSPIIAETNDCAHGIFRPDTGETIAQGRFGLPVFLANMQFTVQNVMVEAKAAGGFNPGDIWIVNDPYLSGTHLQDVVLVAPHFSGDRLVALLASTGHWMDIGGSVPGGWTPSATEIHQEGMLIPPVKIYDRGQINQPLVRMFTTNVRLPEQIAGDLSAMCNVFVGGRRGLDDLIARYGIEVLESCIEEMLARSERQMRSYIEEIPDGVYRAVDHLDNDGVVDRPLKVELVLTVAGSSLHFDFSGCDPAAVGPLNLARTTTLSTAYIALKHLFPEVPVNGGAFRPTTFTIREGSLVAAAYPSPVSGYLEVIGRVFDVILGALAQAIPDRTPAPAFGTIGVVTVGGRHAANGQYFVAVFPYPGGYGAHRGGDGLVNGTPPVSMANFMSIEMSEHRYPLRFDHYAIREDSGGAGEFRGGCGTSYQFRLTGDCVVSALGDRIDHLPFGIAGGHSSSPNRVSVTVGGQELVSPMRSKFEKQKMGDGDLLTAASPGGGGFGDPRLRDVDAVERDLNLGYVSRETAEAVYGAVVETASDVGDRSAIAWRENPELNGSKGPCPWWGPKWGGLGAKPLALSFLPGRKKMLTRRTAILGLAGTTVVLSGARAASPLKIGVINPFSGPAAIYGDEVTRCYSIAIDAQNAKGGVFGRQIEIVRGDAVTPQQGIAAVDQLATKDNVDMFSGTYISAISNSASDAALRYQKSWWETNSLAKELTERGLPNYIRAGCNASAFATISSHAVGQLIAPALKKTPQQVTVWIEHEDSIYGSSIAEIQRQLLVAAGVKIVGMGAHAARATDLTDSVLRAKQANPDVWIETGYVPDGNLLLRAARDQGFKPPAILWVGVGDTNDTLDAVGPEFAEGMLVVGYARADISEEFGPGAAAFLAAYRAKYNRDPIAPQGLSGFVGMTMLMEALTLAGTTEMEKLHEAAAKMDKPLNSYANGYGVKFDENFQNIRAFPAVVQWQSGKPVTVFPEKAKLPGVALKNLPRA